MARLVAVTSGAGGEGLWGGLGDDADASDSCEVDGYGLPTVAQSDEASCFCEPMVYMHAWLCVVCRVLACAWCAWDFLMKFAESTEYRFGVF